MGTQMKISNETKVGVLTVIAVVLLIVGFNYLKGRNVFESTKKIYAVFTDLGSLEKSNEVKINGLPIGTVFQKKEKDKDVSAIVVTINLTRDINIPVNSVAYIASNLVGSSYIVIERGNASQMMQDGDTIQTRKETSFLGDVKAQLDPTISSVREILDSLKNTLAGVNNVLDYNTRQHLRQTIANLDSTSVALHYYFQVDKGPLSKTLSNVESIAEQLKTSMGAIEIAAENAKVFTSRLALVDIQKTADTLNLVITQLKQLSTSLNNGEGTAGALLKERALYDHLQQTIVSAEILLDDIRVHPRRYASFSLFSKKDKSSPLQKPLEKDSILKNNH
jgi:phospholipid/cholesterol/gamma-HCH transport system substrate-binding protein